jgi:hypothetical protein
MCVIRHEKCQNADMLAFDGVQKMDTDERARYKIGTDWEVEYLCLHFSYKFL